VLSASSVFAAEQELRVFQFHFRPAHEAATLVEPMLSGEGSLLLQPGLNAITVRDNPDVLKRVASALASWDVAPQSYKVRVRVFLASREPKSSGPPPPPIPELGEKLYLLFGFTKFQ
jgi:type II secretory pathway component GspD/PulD (secretin)